MSVDLNSRSLIYHINGLKSHLQACSPFGSRKLGPFHKRDINQINRALAAKAQARFKVPKALSTPEPEEIARRTLRKFMRSHANGRNIFAVTEKKKRCDLLHQNFY